MQKLKRLVAVLLITLGSLSLAACETLGIGAKTENVSAASILSQVPKVENSPKSPCWQQRQIAAQRAYIDANVNGTSVKYHADCKDKEPVPASQPPATS